MRVFVAGLSAALLISAPAFAASDVITFSGTVGETCALTVVDGTLALAGNGQTLGSDETGGAAATVTVVSNGVNKVTVGRPTMTDSPATYDATGQDVWVKYAMPSVVTQAYTNAETFFDVGITAGSVLTVNNKITNSNGFRQGDYETQTTVTCF